MSHDLPSFPAAPGPSPKIALTIAGTDSGAGAGIAADLRTFAALGVFGTLVVTAVTAQNTLGVREFLGMPPALVEAQLDALAGGLAAGAAKTGMLGSPEVVKLLAGRAAAGQLPPLVVDPVLVSSSGRPMFAGEDVAGAYRDLFSCAAVITPNLPEAALLTGRPISDLEAMEEAARELHDLGPGLVIVKGGRRRDTEAVDVAFDGHSVTLLRAPWIDTAERARHRLHLLGRHRRQPRPRPRAAPGRPSRQGVRHPGDPGRLAVAPRSRPRASGPDRSGVRAAPAPPDRARLRRPYGAPSGRLLEAQSRSGPRRGGAPRAR